MLPQLRTWLAWRLLPASLISSVFWPLLALAQQLDPATSATVGDLISLGPWGIVAALLLVGRQFKLAIALGEEDRALLRRGVEALEKRGTGGA